MRRKAKYGNRKIIKDGQTFDSVKEARRWFELCLLEKAGEITDLRRQVEFPLLPTQREESTEVYKRGENKGKPKPGKVIEKPVVYIADFVYKHTATGKTIVEDTKGFKTKDYILKRKMLLYFHNIKIREV
jgi:hypothetical protein